MNNIYLNCIVILSIFSISSCNAQKHVIENASCKENVLITFDETDGDYNIIELPQNIKDNYNWLTIKFDKNIRNSIDEVYFDSEPFTLEENKPSTLFYKYSKDKKGLSLFIKLLNDKGCLEILLDKKYNLITLSKPNDQWNLEYSGYYEITWKI